MAIQTYNSIAQINTKFKGEVLARAEPQEKLTKIGAMLEIPRNKSETIEFPRYLPYGGVDNQWIAAGADINAYVNAHVITEGVTPNADTISRTTVSTTLQEIGCLYSYTNRAFIQHEDGTRIPTEMKDQVATRLVLCRELKVYGKTKEFLPYFAGGIAAVKGNVNTVCTAKDFQRISRNLQVKHAGMITSMLSSSPNYGSKSIDAGWTCYTHTDMEAAFENMVGFKKVADYGSQKKIDPDEIGCVGRFRIITSPILTYEAGAGAVAGAGILRQAITNKAHIYPIIIFGKGKSGGDCFGQVALRGKDSLDTSHIPVGTKSHSDPMGLRGYVGATAWQAPIVLNREWGAVLYTACEEV